MTLGSSVAVTGQLCTARTQVELQANNVEVIGTCDPVVSCTPLRERSPCSRKSILQKVFRLKKNG